MCIVSPLLSTTETIYAQGRGDPVVGVTHEGDDPPQSRGTLAVTQSMLGYIDNSFAKLDTVVLK